MDADIKALENEVAKINPPPHPPPIIQPPIIPSNQSRTTLNPSPYYTATRGQPTKPPIQYHPYGPPPPPAAPTNTTAVTAAAIQQQIAARNVIAQAQVQAVRLQAQAAAINAARTRTLMSAAAQAQAAMARANNTNSSIIISGPNKPSSSTSNNSHKTHHDNNSSSNNNVNTIHSVGPSYTKNTLSSYENNGNSNNSRSYHHKNHHYHHNNRHHHHHHHHGYGGYNSYDHKKTTTTIPNSSLRNHLHDMDYQNGGKAPKKKKLRASHQYQLRTAAKESWVDATMTDWPENDFRIFCGDLGNEVSDAMLTSAFSKYPSFAKAKVVRDKRTGKSKGYGFVSFLEPHDFIRAFKEMNGKYVGNRPIKLRRSKWKDRMKKVKNFKIRE